MSTEAHKIILFDGVCNLCNSSVQFIIPRDKKKVFRYASLQSDLGAKLMKERNIDPNAIDSILLIDPKKAYYIKSTAAIQIAKHLQAPYPLMVLFLILPLFIRDKVYDFIARNRYKWFGKSTHCSLPTEATKSLFLE